MFFLEWAYSCLEKNNAKSGDSLQGKIVNKYLIVQPGVCSREQTTFVSTYKVEYPDTTSYKTEACVPLQQR